MNWEIRFDSNTLCVCQPLGRVRLCDPMNCSSPPGPSVHGALQAGTLDWAASLFSRGSFQPRDRILHRPSHQGSSRLTTCESVAKRNLPSSTASSASCSVPTQRYQQGGRRADGGRSGREGIHVHMRLSYFPVQQEVTQCYRAITLQWRKGDSLLPGLRGDG